MQRTTACDRPLDYHLPAVTPPGYGYGYGYGYGAGVSSVQY